MPSWIVWRVLAYRLTPRGTDARIQDVTPFDVQYHFTLVAIAVPTNITHVQGAIACAAKLGVNANAGCGGHSYASFGFRGERTAT